MNKRIIAYEVNQFYKTLGNVCPKYKNVRIKAEDLAKELTLSDIIYDIEGNSNVYESATELRAKLNGIKRKHKIARGIGSILAAVGFICILGTAGASDLGNISLVQTVVQAVISLGVSALGLAVIKKMED